MDIHPSADHRPDDSTDQAQGDAATSSPRQEMPLESTPEEAALFAEVQQADRPAEPVEVIVTSGDTPQADPPARVTVSHTPAEVVDEA